jgi:cytochrome oxidase assembly protein ShyY1
VSFGFLLSRRWLLFGLFAVLLAVTCWRLGVWQFDRLAEQKAENAIIRRNLQEPPVPAARVMGPGHPLPEQQIWRKVSVTGTYDMADETLVRYQVRNGTPGVTVLTPLRTVNGATVLVDRGWMRTSNDPRAPVHPPPPAPGLVTVTGWALPDQSSGDPDDITPIQGEVRLVSSRGFTGLTRGPVMHGYISAQSERPAPARTLVQAAPPQLSNGPHFSYALQWWFFATLAVGGFGYFAYAESRDRRRRR